MNKFIIYSKREAVCCKVVKGEVTYYVNNTSDFSNILSLIMSAPYIVKIKGDRLLLKSQVYSCLIEDYKNTLSHAFVHHFKEHILNTISINGFLDLTDREKLDKKVKKSTKFSGKIIKRVAVTALSASIIYCVFSSILPSKSVSASDIQITDTIIESQIDNSNNEDIIAYIDEKEIEEVEDNLEVFEDASQEIESEPVTTANLEFEDLSNTDKAISTKENYYDYIVSSAKKMGLDPNLMLGIATQEKGVHSSEIDAGGAVGLMQIQYRVWVNTTLSYYELDEDANTFVQKSILITDEKLRDVKSNIEISCMILQACLLSENYNIPLAVTSYNMGTGSMNKVLKAYSNSTGKSVLDIVNNPEDLGWTSFRYLVNCDTNYLENINKWIDVNSFTVTNVLTGEKVSIEFTNQNEEELHSLNY